MIEVVLTLVVMVSCSFLFVKAGRPFWAPFIPLYNFCVFVGIAKVHEIWGVVLFTVLFIPLAVVSIFKGAETLFIFTYFVCGVFFLFANVYIFYRLAVLFGFGWLMGMGLFFLPFVFLPYLAFNEKVTYHSERLEWLG